MNTGDEQLRQLQASMQCSSLATLDALTSIQDVMAAVDAPIQDQQRAAANIEALAAGNPWSPWRFRSSGR